LSAYAGLFQVHLLPAFGENTDITQKDIDLYLSDKSNAGIPKKTLESRIIALKSLLKWANKTGIFVTKNFRTNYPSSAKEKEEIRPLTVEEAKAFCKYCEDNFNFINLALYTTLFTGLRAGEMCGLQFKDIDVERGYLSVTKIAYRVHAYSTIKKDGEKATEVIIGPPKTKASIREIPLSKQLLFYYKALCKICNPEFYIVSNAPTPLEPRTLRYYLDKVLEATNLPDIRLHDLRHTFATRCIAAGVDAKTVSVLLGHSNASTTLNIYTHVDEDAKTEAINKLNKKMAW
jgi:integrase